jgi:copper homeostasis protein (lipoprotein)
LYPDGAFFLRREYMERPVKSYDSGKYEVQLTPPAKLVLHTGEGEKQQFSVGSGVSSVTMLDQEGKPIESKRNYTLKRSEEVDPIYDRMPWRGMYMYMADAATYTDCATGRRYGISPSDESPAMERAYGENAKEPRAPVFVEFEGHRGMLEDMEGNKREMLVVDKLGRFVQGRSCEDKPKE